MRNPFSKTQARAGKMAKCLGVHTVFSGGHVWSPALMPGGSPAPVILTPGNLMAMTSVGICTSAQTHTDIYKIIKSTLKRKGKNPRATAPGE